MKQNYMHHMLIGGALTLLSATILHAQPGSIDASLATGSGFTKTSGTAFVRTALLQQDGKIVLTGDFNLYNGTPSNHVIRLNPGGTADAAFSTGSGFDESVTASVLQPDNKLIAGGSFSSYNGVSAFSIIRIASDGSADGTFSTGSGFEGKKGAGSVSALALQPDGKVIAGGNFSGYNGAAVTNIARLGTNGALDASFTASVNHTISCIQVLPDGKIIIAGNFTEVNGTARNRIARLNANGTLDAGFNPGTGFNNSVSDIVILPDGRLTIGGTFTEYNGSAAHHLVRLQADGSVDASLSSAFAASDYVFSLALQPDGKILVGGNFTHYASRPVKSLVRLHPDGTSDTGFQVGTGFTSGASSNGQIHCIALQPDGKLIVTGVFDKFANLAPHNGLIRLNGYIPALQITALYPATGICPGTKMAVYFATGIGQFNPGNTFTAQLSDASGSFSNPVNIGTVTGTTGGLITGIIPSGLSGSGFRIRVTASNPVHSGPSNGTDLSIASSGTLPAVTAGTSASDICLGTDITLTAGTTEADISWSDNVVNGLAFPPDHTHTYTVTASKGGCSTTDQVTINVKDLPVVTASVSADTVCHGYEVTLTANGATSYVWDHHITNGQPFQPDSTTLYTVTGTDAQGCSNTDTVRVTVLPSGSSALDQVICKGTVYTLGSQTLSTSGTYTERFPGIAANGCDSMVTIHLSVIPDTFRIQREEMKLTVTASSGATYQWLNCDDGSTPIIGAVEASFEPNLPGVFAVVVTENGCSDTSACIPLWPASVRETSRTDGIRVYPNPVQDQLYISGKEIGTLTLTNIEGRIIYQASYPSGTESVSLSSVSWAPGTYILRIETEAGREIIKISR